MTANESARQVYDKTEYAIRKIAKREARKTGLPRERLMRRTRFLDAENKSLIAGNYLLLVQLIYKLA